MSHSCVYLAARECWDEKKLGNRKDRFVTSVVLKELRCSEMTSQQRSLGKNRGVSRRLWPPLRGDEESILPRQVSPCDLKNVR